jgi:uroporphyrinogen decarboxylase
MTGKERMIKILSRQKADRIGLCEHFWTDTRSAWIAEGKIREDDSFADIFGLDVEECWPFNMTADINFKPRVLAETEETITLLDGNGAVLRNHKLHDSTPEHVDFKVKEREEWERSIKGLLVPDPGRIDFEVYRKAKARAAAGGRFFVWKGGNVFETIKSMCGHENMLMGMALDPDWVLDMAMTYAKLTVELQKILFEKEGVPDGVWYCEDMGFKLHPFMSPQMYRDLIKPAHEQTFNYAHSLNLPVVVHSCGFVEPLVPDMIDAGMNCLQAMEVKAGMDLLKLHRLYGDKISFIGGIDVRVLYSNDRKKIDAELEAKIPIVKKGYNYAVHSDHSIPKTVNYETYRYFIDKALELGAY